MRREKASCLALACRQPPPVHLRCNVDEAAVLDRAHYILPAKGRRSLCSASHRPSGTCYQCWFEQGSQDKGRAVTNDHAANQHKGVVPPGQYRKTESKCHWVRFRKERLRP